MSYKHGRKGEVFRLFVNNSANHSLGFAVWRASFWTNIQLGHQDWSHVFWIWESKRKAGITLGDPAARGGAASVLFADINLKHVWQYKNEKNLKEFPYKDNGDKFTEQFLHNKTGDHYKEQLFSIRIYIWATFNYRYTTIVCFINSKHRPFK